MSLESSILNPITFKRIEGSYPNDYNCLHINRKHGTRSVNSYSQLFNYDDIITVEFSSDVATVPTLKAYQGVTVIDTITGALGANSPRTGSEGTIYYFVFHITLDSAYFDKDISFRLTQGSDRLDSEPILVTDLDDLIEKGEVKRVDYSNYDRVESDLNGKLIDWEDIDTTDNLLFFYIRGVDFQANDKEEEEILEGSMSGRLISASFTPGINFQTDAVPLYMCKRLTAVCQCDYIAVNEIEYLKGGAVKKDPFGGSTSYQCEVALQEKEVLWFNIDNDEITSEMREIINHPFAEVVTDFDDTAPTGYNILHYIEIKHNAGSSGNAATLKIGSFLGGENFLDSTVEITDSVDGNGDHVPHSFAFHNTTKKVFVEFVSGAGVKLDFNIQYIIET